MVDAAGSAVTTVLVLTLLGVWVGIGFAEGFTEHWLELLFAVSAAVTLVMVFLIQHTSDRRERAILLKLDELIHSLPEADDQLIAAERRPLHEQEDLESTVEKNALS